MPALSLLEQPRYEVKKKSAGSLLVVLPIAGLIAGLLTASLDGPLSRVKVPERYGLFAPGFLGVPFGVLIAVSLVAGRVLRRFGALWKTLAITALSSAAYLVAFYAAFGVEFFFGQPKSMSQSPSYSLLTMFVGGFVGGFIVLYGVLLLLHPWRICVSVMFRILLSSVLTGVLGIVGWKLGGEHPLFVVWQPGTAFLLALILKSAQTRSVTLPATK